MKLSKNFETSLMGSRNLSDVHLAISKFSKTHFAFLAGGSLVDILQGRTPKDYDLFFRSRAEFDSFESELVQAGARKSSTSKNSVTYMFNGLQLDLVCKHFFVNIEEVFSSFDLINCCIGVELHIQNNIVEWKHWQSDSMFDGCFLTKILQFNDLALQRMVPENIVFALSRAAKYQEKGFEINSNFVRELSNALGRQLGMSTKGYGGLLPPAAAPSVSGLLPKDETIILNKIPMDNSPLSDPPSVPTCSTCHMRGQWKNGAISCPGCWAILG